MKIYQTEETQARPRTDRPTMAFATMCKNEEHIIGTVLEAVAPYIDYLVVADNGSTDRTLEIAREYMEKHNIPGEIHLDDWEGFDKNKNKMMEYVFDKADYVLHLDADDIMAGDFSFNNEDTGYDNYFMTMKRGTSTWKATVIYNNRMHWKFCGVAHTVIKCIEKPEGYTTGDLSSRGYVIADGVGSRAFDPKKFYYDAERLTKQFWDTLTDDPDDLNTRSVFYTAQSYMDYGKEDSYEQALKWNRLYLKLKNTWIEEYFEAQMRISLCMMKIERYTPAEIIAEMEKAIEIFPDRAEPHMRLGTYLNGIGMHDLAYHHLSLAKSKNLESVKEKYILFVDDTAYNEWVNDELSVACFWTGRYEEGVALINEIIDDERWEYARPRILENLQHFNNAMNAKKKPESVDTLIIGGGITGLSTAAFLGNESDYLVLEGSNELGGYCKTIERNGFVWDYSGHFFHFRNAEIKDYVMENMGCEVHEVKKITDIDYNGTIVDFPFQYNINQLPAEEFHECLNDMENLGEVDYTSFKSFIKTSLGNGICEKFLIPYNEKLYATDLDNLDAGAMGRFFPKPITKEQLLKRMYDGKHHESYNDTFIYPTGGAYEFVKSILTRVDENKILKNCTVLSIDTENKVARTTLGDIKFNKLVSTTPLNRLTNMMNIDFEVLSSNKVAVLNLGFDKGTDIKSHWRYFPNKDVSFYRIGFYNNILGQDKMSLYVEIGLPSERVVNEEELTAQVMNDLVKVGIVTDQNLVDGEFLVMDPAYVHITKRSEKAYQDWCEEYNPMGIYSIGRYGSWTYCSIEDNIIQAKETAELIKSKGTENLKVSYTGTL